MTGDDAYTILAAYVGGDDDGFLSAFDVDSATAGDIAGLVKKLREENEHLRNQLNAASERVEVMRTKRGYAREAAWLPRGPGDTRAPRRARVTLTSRGTTETT